MSHHLPNNETEVLPTEQDRTDVAEAYCRIRDDRRQI